MAAYLYQMEDPLTPTLSRQARLATFMPLGHSELQARQGMLALEKDRMRGEPRVSALILLIVADATRFVTNLCYIRFFWNRVGGVELWEIVVHRDDRSFLRCIHRVVDFLT